MNRVQDVSLSQAIQAGAIAGLAGGLVFGAMMAMQGMLNMVGMLVEQDNALIGFIVHMIISAFIGASFGALIFRYISGWAPVIAAGAAYGVVWWVLGALILMPLMLGMNNMVLQIGSMQWQSLVGHIVFGVVTALVFVPLARRF
jgi:uncharacterized membrane protein YagU involved in acid resistance